MTKIIWHFFIYHWPTSILVLFSSFRKAAETEMDMKSENQWKWAIYFYPASMSLPQIPPDGFLDCRQTCRCHNVKRHPPQRRWRQKRDIDLSINNNEPSTVVPGQVTVSAADGGGSFDTGIQFNRKYVLFVISWNFFFFLFCPSICYMMTHSVRE